jgi:hypothetical protein
MDHQNAFPGGSHVDCGLLDLDVAIGPTKVSDQLVVIARDINHMRALAGFAQNFLDHVVVRLWPINSAPQRPDVDQVAHDVECLKIVFAQKIQQRGCVAAARPQVRVGDPCSAIASGRKKVLSRFAK